MKSKLALVAIVTTVLLQGCGGGGGGSASPAPTPTPTPTPTPDPTALQTSVPTPTYAAGSLEMTAITALNNIRGAYGVGQLAQSTQIDQAALNHAQYLLTRLQAGDYAAVGHTEDASKPGYTGASPADRIAFAKYSASQSGENLISFIEVDGVTSIPGTVAIDALVSGPYHRFAFFDPNRDIGFGQSSARLPGEGGVRHTVVADFAVAQNAQQQLPAADWIGLWPADQATNVMYSFAGESPDPIPANHGACAGYTVSVQARSGTTLTTTSFTLAETATAAPVSAQLSTAQNDANPTQARANTAYIIPFKPLKLSTKYTAHFVGTRGAVAIDKTWTFTTAGQNTKMIFGCDPS
jgi:uncharacterized protein YkwD